mmetsp:Transcript_16650/g.41195  ORF Transcript_16650/g.41195 Transcript_16650/m.41195 type:complete len:276 (-) Transcript_16650:1543-2370(-)
MRWGTAPVATRFPAPKYASSIFLAQAKAVLRRPDPAAGCERKTYPQNPCASPIALTQAWRDGWPRPHHRALPKRRGPFSAAAPRGHPLPAFRPTLVAAPAAIAAVGPADTEFRCQWRRSVRCWAASAGPLPATLTSDPPRAYSSPRRAERPRSLFSVPAETGGRSLPPPSASLPVAPWDLPPRGCATLADVHPSALFSACSRTRRKLVRTRPPRRQRCPDTRRVTWPEPFRSRPPDYARAHGLRSCIREPSSSASSATGAGISQTGILGDSASSW